MDKDPLQRRIYFLTFVESLEMIFSHYTETCEVLLYHPKIGGDNIIEDYAKKVYQKSSAVYINVCMQKVPDRLFLHNIQ